MKSTPLFLLLSLIASGCGKVTYTQGNTTPLIRENPAFHHVGIIGLVEFSKPIPIHDICPDGFERVDVRTNALTALIQGVTFNLYTPTQTFVQCKSGNSYRLDLDENGDVLVAMEVDRDQ